MAENHLRTVSTYKHSPLASFAWITSGRSADPDRKEAKASEIERITEALFKRPSGQQFGFWWRVLFIVYWLSCGVLGGERRSPSKGGDQVDADKMLNRECDDKAVLDRWLALGAPFCVIERKWHRKLRGFRCGFQSYSQQHVSSVKGKLEDVSIRKIDFHLLIENIRKLEIRWHWEGETRNVCINKLNKKRSIVIGVETITMGTTKMD